MRNVGVLTSIISLPFVISIQACLAQGANSANSHQATSNLVPRTYCTSVIKLKVFEQIRLEDRNLMLGKEGQVGVELSNLSVHLAERTKLVSGDVFGHGYHRTKKFPIYFYYPVKRIGGNNFVAVIGERTIAPALLNPEFGFDYGVTPGFEEMTLQNADELWGPPLFHNGNELRTYRLISTDPSKKEHEFFLDVEFLDGKLKKYRVRGELIMCPGWLSDNKEELRK
jgi:hypothetical protein